MSGRLTEARELTRKRIKNEGVGTQATGKSRNRAGDRHQALVLAGSTRSLMQRGGASAIRVRQVNQVGALCLEEERQRPWPC